MSRVVTGIDTNVLLYAINVDAPESDAAAAFLHAHRDDPDTVISELVLAELYVLLRNPAVMPSPLSAPRAAAIVHAFRTHPRWRLVDHDPAVMDDLWRRMARPGVARRRLFDVRLGLGLVRHGVTHFATRNVDDFDDLGFAKVFDPL